MSAMSASPVKPPVLPPAGVPVPPPPVVTSPQKAFPNLPANLPASLTIAPTKPTNMNHSSMPLSLIADSKMTSQFPAHSQPGIPALQPISQPLLRTPEKPKELTTVPFVMPPKPTSNGMEGLPVPPPAIPEPQVTALPPPIPPPKPEVPEAAQPSMPEPTPVPLVAAVSPAVEQKIEVKEEPLTAKPAVVATPIEALVAEPTAAAAPIPVATATAAPVQPLPEPAVPPTPPTHAQTPTTAAAAAATAPPAPAPAPQLKVATIPRQAAKRKRENKPASGPGPAPDTKKEVKEKDEDRKSKRVRLPTQPYQSPIPELTIIAKISKGQTASASKPGRGQTKASDDKLIVFYKNEFLAVRNAEGGFYVCQTMQNIYKSSPRIRIRWLSQQDGKDTYSPDFYDHTDFDCILTNLNLEKVDKDVWRLPGEEHQRTQSILKRALDVERGVSEKPPVTEEHPDGLDLSLYRDESQLKKSKRRGKDSSRKSSSSKSEEEDENQEDDDEEQSEDDSEEEKASKKTDKKSSPKTKRKKKSAKKKTPPEKKAASSAKSVTATKRTESSRAVKRRTSDPQPPAPEKRAKKAETSSERSSKLRSVGERRAKNRK